jgi:hypothetical protein
LGFSEYTGIRLCPIAIMMFMVSLKHDRQNSSDVKRSAHYYYG